MTGWVVRGSERGARVSYVSRTDPRGRLPAWLVNAVTRELGPKMAKKLHAAALKYPDWKEQSARPNYMPWRCPDQIPSERISIADVSFHNYFHTIMDLSCSEQVSLQHHDVSFPLHLPHDLLG